MLIIAKPTAGEQAAARGLQEELGITADASSLEGPIVPVHLRQLDVPELGVRDHEFVTSFRYATTTAADCLLTLTHIVSACSGLVVSRHAAQT